MSEDGAQSDENPATDGQSDTETASQSETGSFATEGETSTVRQILKYGGGALLVLFVVIVVLVLLGVLGVPDGALDDNQWGEVDNESIEVITTVRVDNPNPVGATADAEYNVTMQEVRIAEGEGKDLSIDPGENAVELRTDLYQDRLPAWWSRHLNNDEQSQLIVNATVDAAVGPFSTSRDTAVVEQIPTDIEGALDQSFSEFEGEYPEAAPAIEIRQVDTGWGEVTENRTEIVMNATIHNPNLAPIPTPSFTGAIEFNDIRIAEWDAGEVELRDAPDDATIPPRETEQRTFVVVMNNQRVPEWFASHVEQEEFTEMVVSGQLAVEVQGREVTIPPRDGGVACEFEMTTAIFVDQNSSVEFQSCGVTPVTGGSGDDAGENGGDDGGVLPDARVETLP
jgi:LEA14-like dessication related protein